MTSDPDTIEAVARWLEGCATHGKPWELRQLAASLRTGSWRLDPQRRTDEAILTATADDKLSRGVQLGQLTGPELAAILKREQRRDQRRRADERRMDRLITQLTTIDETGGK